MKLTPKGNSFGKIWGISLFSLCQARRVDFPFAGGREGRGEGVSRRSSAPFVLFLFSLLSLFVLFSSPTFAQSPIQVGLVVQSAPGDVITKCVTLNQPNPSGWEVLVAANVGVVGSPSGMGMAVCAIANVGCPANDCWCKFNSGENLYWSYWHLKGSGWVYSNLGASNYFVSQGEVEGWIWGDGRTPPPIFSFEQICAPPPTATFPFTPLPTATFTSTAAPSATPVVLPTSTPKPRSPTSTSIILPTASPTPLTPTAVWITQPSLRTPTLTPSATITLPFGVILAATTVAPAQNLPQSVENPPTEPALDLQSLSLTATAVEASRQPELAQGEAGKQEVATLLGFGIHTLEVAYMLFFALIGSLLIVLIILVRRRGSA